MSKYKVSDLAKDFGVSSKEISAILAPLGGEAKKSSNALEENELDYIFNKMTVDNSVTSFDAYFAAGNEAREKAKNAAKAEMDKLEQIFRKAVQQSVDEKLKGKVPASGIGLTTDTESLSDQDYYHRFARNAHNA